MFACWPRELLERCSSHDLTELIAYYRVKDEERRAEEWQRKLDGLRHGR